MILQQHNSKQFAYATPKALSNEIHKHIRIQFLAHTNTNHSSIRSTIWSQWNHFDLYQILLDKIVDPFSNIVAQLEIGYFLIFFFLIFIQYIFSFLQFKESMEFLIRYDIFFYDPGDHKVKWPLLIFFYSSQSHQVGKKLPPKKQTVSLQEGHTKIYDFFHSQIIYEPNIDQKIDPKQNRKILELNI